MIMNVTWFDGRFVRSDRAQINVLSHALHYGTGVYEGIRAYKTAKGPAIFRLSEHVDRFFRSANALGMKLPYTRAEVITAIKKTVTKNNLIECYIRPIAFFGEGNMGLLPGKAALHGAISAWPWGAYLGAGRPLSVGISSYIRFHPQSVIPGIKISGLYAAAALASIEAHKRHFDECIMLDHKGNVSEGPGENIFMVRGKKLFTPDSASALPGITRQSVMTIAKDMGMTVFEKSISPRELMTADELFFTGTAVEVASIKKVNGRRIGKSKTSEDITSRIRGAYLDAVHGKIPRYQKWLSYI